MNGLVELPYAWNTKGGSITVPLTSFLTGLESAALQLTNYIHVFICNAEAGSLNKRLMLSSSFWCDQILKYEIYNFDHTLLCYLSPT